MGGTQRFSGLQRRIPGVSQRMLTKQLGDLERHGLVRRRFFEEIPPRVEYSATELGRSLHPIYKRVCDWSERWWDRVQRARTEHDRLGVARRG